MIPRSGFSLRNLLLIRLVPLMIVVFWTLYSRIILNHGPGSSPRSLYGLRKLLLVVIALAPMLVIVQITFGW